MGKTRRAVPRGGPLGLVRETRERVEHDEGRNRRTQRMLRSGIDFTKRVGNMLRDHIDNHPGGGGDVQWVPVASLRAQQNGIVNSTGLVLPDLTVGNVGYLLAGSQRRSMTFRSSLNFNAVRDWVSFDTPSENAFWALALQLEVGAARVSGGTFGFTSNNVYNSALAMTGLSSSNDEWMFGVDYALDSGTGASTGRHLFKIQLESPSVRLINASSSPFQRFNIPSGGNGQLGDAVVAVTLYGLRFLP